MVKKKISESENDQFIDQAIDFTEKGDEQIESSTKIYKPEKMLPDNFSVIVFGKRRSGKTFQIRKLVYAIHKRFTDAYLFSNITVLRKSV